MPNPISGITKVFFGILKATNENIYITIPTWDCGWYWSFGYLGNRNRHYHLNAYANKDHMFELKDGMHRIITENRNKNMYDCLLEDYDLNPTIKSNLWQFCELAKTIYTLKETAEILGRGGSHYTTNLCKNVIINTDEVERLNSIVIPKLCQEFWDLITPEK